MIELAFKDDLRGEATRYGDLLFGDFADTYENLALKTIFAYQFAVNNCTNVDFYFFQERISKVAGNSYSLHFLG